jgi:hypothetical protein
MEIRVLVRMKGHSWFHISERITIEKVRLVKASRSWGAVLMYTACGEAKDIAF